MNKIRIATASIVMIMSVTSSFGQTLEIIDAIAGTLLPKVVQGIKDIKGSGDKERVRVDRKVLDTSVKDLNEYVKGITGALANDAKSLDAIGKMAASASLLYDDLGAMEAFINNNLITSIIDCNNEPVKRQFALAFDRDYKQLIDNINGVKTSVLDLEIDQSLKDNLASLVDEVKGEQKDFDSYMIQSGAIQPTAASKITEIDNYLAAMKNSSKEITEIKKAIQRMLSTLNSRLSSYIKTVSTTKVKVDAKFDELVIKAN
jgi:hypothetical protein